MMNLLEHLGEATELMGPECEELCQLTVDRHVGKSCLARCAKMKGMT